MSLADTVPAGDRKEDVMFAIVRRVVFELGTGRAAANARREHQSLELVHARIEALGRRLEVATAPADPQSDTAAA
jgi:hypothetical protein